MKRFLNSFFLLCGLSLALAALPVFGQSEAVVNKESLKDFAAYLKTKNIDWTKSFLVEAETVLSKDGKFDREKTKFTKTEGDAELIEVAKKGFEAAGESGWLVHLKNQDVDNIKMSASQNSEIFTFSLIFEQLTPQRAATLTSGLNMLFKTALMFDKNGTKKLADDEKKLLTGTKVTAQEKTVNINVSLAANDFREIVRRKLNEEKEKTAK
jgi:hypothetical protein